MALPVSGSSCANLFWIGASGAGTTIEGADTGAGSGAGKDGTEATALQDLAGRLEPWYLLAGEDIDLEERLSHLTPSFHSQLYVIHQEAKVWKVWELYDAGGERVKNLVANWWPGNLTSNLLEAERWETHKYCGVFVILFQHYWQKEQH